MNLEDGLILRPFGRLTVVGVPLRPASSQPCFLIYSTRHALSPVEWDLNPIKKQLLIFITFVPLLHTRAYLTVLVVTVAHRIHS